VKILQRITTKKSELDKKQVIGEILEVVLYEVIKEAQCKK
jgi:hypothetical protein